ncbi:DUF305 domain-containing protein [Nocardia brasiliensis]|uniref:DUF305 domain-containing protein n=1 Tax=Nocardia brasiliensis TaxID=37326 RepID=UPI001895CC71|nr:DUF305 domain-containing protein [Nocardia brasiliensis]MBF6543600.1 DUF305 domain-containing protein [Nocardia brasiliensis]
MNRYARTAVVVAVGLVVVAAAFGVGRRTVRLDSEAAPNRVDIGFAQDMREHHSQAATMSLTILDRTQDPDLRRLAADIASTQLVEIGMLTGWLQLWHQPEQSDHSMSWMAGASDAAEHSMGMASGSEQQQLSTLPGPDAEQLYLRLVRTHHLAGIHMAHIASDLAGTPQVRNAAAAMSRAQQLDITRIDALVALRTLARSAR